MRSSALTPMEYLEQLPPDRIEPMIKLRKTILDNLPDGFEETMGYGMISYVVPHSIYPSGYHCDPKQPLPFMNLASQKNYMAFYHMGLYIHPELTDWFTSSYQAIIQKKPDMGKSCLRLKKEKDIPYDLIGELVTKISPEKWISMYETSFRK